MEKTDKSAEELMKIFVRQYQNLGGSWTCVWRLGKNYFFNTIEWKKV